MKLIPIVLVALFYTALTCFKFNVHKTDLFHSFLGATHPDYINIVWFLGWDLKHLLHGFSGYWDAPFYTPHAASIGFGDHVLGQSALVLIPYALTKSVVFSYNILFILTFVLTGLASYLLFVSITGHKTASLLTSFAFNFCQFRYGVLSQTYVLAIYPTIFFLAFAQRFVNDKGRAPVFLWSAYVCLIWQVFCALNMGIYAFYIATLFFLYYLWLEPALRQKRVIAQILSGHIVTGLVFVWISLPNLIVVREQAQSWSWGDVVLGAARLGMLVSLEPTSLWSTSWMKRFFDQPFTYAFPGVFVLTAFGFALARWIPNQGVIDQSRWRRAASAALLVIAAGTAIVSVVAFFPGMFTAWGIEVKTEISGRALLLALVAVALNRRWRSAVIQIFANIPAPLRFYALLAAGGFFFSFSLFFKIPYFLAPGLGNVRTPGRLLEYFQLGLCALATVGISPLLNDLKSIRNKGLVAALVTLLFVENMHSVPPDRALPLPTAHQWLIGRKDVKGIIELPFPEQYPDHKDYVFWTTFHWTRTVHGYSSFYPRDNHFLQIAMRHHPLPPIDYLRALQVSHVICHWNRMDASTRARIEVAASAAHLPLILQSKDSGVYRVPEGSWLELPLKTASLPSGSRLETSVRTKYAARAWDGKRKTVWKTGRAQEKGDWVEVTFPRPIKIQGAVMWLGKRFLDFPRHIRVEGNINGQWMRLMDWTSPTPSAEDFRRVVETPVDASTTLRWPPAECSALKFSLTGDSEKNHWSIAELNVIDAGS